MYEAIIAICNQLVGEATAILGYTDDIAKLSVAQENGKVVALLDEIRIDEVEHVQKLAIQLTECFYTKGEAQEAGAKKSNEQEESEG